MAEGQGWGEVRTFLDDNVRRVEDKLFKEDLEKEEFDKLKVERAAYKSILNFVDRRVKEVRKNNQGG